MWLCDSNKSMILLIFFPGAIIRQEQNVLYSPLIYHTMEGTDRDNKIFSRHRVIDVFNVTNANGSGYQGQ
jgi:hypothetical protein